MRISRLLKRKIWIPIILGLLLIFAGQKKQEEMERTSADGIWLYNAAFLALNAGDVEASYNLFAEASLYAKDSKLRADALYNAAAVALFTKQTDFNTLVSLYKESLRNDIGFYEPSRNLEWLYLNQRELPASSLPGVGKEGNGPI